MKQAIGQVTAAADKAAEYGGSVKEVRVNKGAWATVACGAASGHIMKIGSNVSSSADMFHGQRGREHDAI